MNYQQLEHKLKKIKPELRSLGVKRIGVFGSYAKGLQNEESDIDIVVEIERPMGLIKFAAIRELLSKELQKPVDLLTFESIKPNMKEEVLREIRYV